MPKLACNARSDVSRWHAGRHASAAAAAAGVLTAGCCPHAAAAGWAGRLAGPTPVWIGRPGVGGEAVVIRLLLRLLQELLLRCCVHQDVPQAVQQVQAQHPLQQEQTNAPCPHDAAYLHTVLHDAACFRSCWASPHLWQRAGQVVVVEAAGRRRQPTHEGGWRCDAPLHHFATAGCSRSWCSEPCRRLLQLTRVTAPATIDT